MRSISFTLLLFSFLNCLGIEPRGNCHNRSLSLNDTIKILEIDTTESMFRGATETRLSGEDLSLIESLINYAATDHNLKLDSFQRMYSELRPLENYNKQYIPYERNGERCVFVNCFDKRLVSIHPDWMKNLVSVDGGGSLYFSLTINLTAKNYLNFWVNAPI
jgi:hypothetical protein